jgi:hypothetical protein
MNLQSLQEQNDEKKVQCIAENASLRLRKAGQTQRVFEGKRKMPHTKGSQ